MSDFSTRPAAKATEDQDGGATDDGGSPLRSETTRPLPSFWGRAARMLFPNHGANLRDNIADALLEETPDIDEGFTREERDMLRNILRFREIRVADIMVARANIEAVEENVSIRELMNLFEASGRSRMPVYRETLDDPRGMVHIRDLLSFLTRQARKTDGLDLGRVDLSTSLAQAGIIRPVLFVPASMHAADLLLRMRSSRTQLALVIDEYGGTDGLVAHEDVVELVVGDIEDEHDDEETLIMRADDKTLVADARIELEDLAEALGPDFDLGDEGEDVDTLGGLLFSKIGHLPARGDVVRVARLPSFEFQILDADPRRIKRVRIVRLEPPAPEAEIAAARRAAQKAAAEAGSTDEPEAASH